MSTPHQSPYAVRAAAPSVAVPARGQRARRAYELTAWLFAACVVAQVFLAGLAIFADPLRWAWHRTFVHIFELLPLIMLVLAFLGRLPAWMRWVTGGLYVLLMLQYATAEIGGMAGAFHPVNALLLFWAALTLARRAGRVAVATPDLPTSPATAQLLSER